MSKIQQSKITDDVYGNLIYLTNGIIELKASLDFGPRILHFGLVNAENVFYNDTAKSNINETAFSEFGGDIMKTYGGHRLWASPEIMPRCYYPDNHPVQMMPTPTGVVLEAPPEQFNNIQKVIELKLSEDTASVEVIHKIVNVGSWDIVFAPWAVTMMAPGGVEVIPQTDAPTGLLCNRLLGVWPYTHMGDERVFWGDHFITLRQDPSNERKFKIGTNNEQGWAAYFYKSNLFIKRYEHVVDGVYADFSGCSFETYTDERFLEIESLGQIGVVAPQRSVSHTERWSLYPNIDFPGNNEAQLKDVLAKYV